MAELVRDRTPDATLALLRQGYAFVSRRCEALGTDVFETRLLGQRVVCMQGEEAARVFYEPGRITRQGAIPPTVLKLLQAKGSVATLNDAAHRRRKAMFISLMSRESLDRLCGIFSETWRRRMAEWQRAPSVVLLDALNEVFCEAVCAWAGVPISENELPRRSRELAEMIEGAGTLGPRHWRALWLRRRHERWAREIVRRARTGRLKLPQDGPLAVIARHECGEQGPLDTATAAVELINLLRPTLAVGRFVVFAALALHKHPEWRPRLAEDAAARWMFAQEVRRHYPFFPAVGGRVRQPFDWRGRRFEPGALVVLDLYGSDHDPRTWDEPQTFRPERFRDRVENAYDLIPQGGGDHYRGHRCPGEWITIDLLQEALRLLTAEMDYEVPPQDLEVDLARVPARPASGFVISGVSAIRSDSRSGCPAY